METGIEEIVEKKGALEEARLQADRCIYCADPRCVAACPDRIGIPRLLSAMAGGVDVFSDVLSARGNLFDNIAHDLRTPLCVIIGSVGLILPRVLGPVE